MNYNAFHKVLLDVYEMLSLGTKYRKMKKKTFYKTLDTFF